MSDGIQTQAFEKRTMLDTTFVKACMIEGCDRRPYARSLCESHYRRLQRRNLPLGPSNVRRWEERLTDGFDIIDTGCWQWRGSLGDKGYGRIQIDKKLSPVHRVMWEFTVGPIGDGLQIDHLCRNRACVNPDHLEPVTQAENIRRGESPSAKHAVKTHCPRGHAYDEANTYVAPNGGRQCRACKRVSVDA